MITVLQAADDTQRSWQDRLLEASYVAISNGSPSLHNSADAIELFGAIDNTSSQYPGFCQGVCVACPDDKPLWWLVLRWLKMMLFKVARSYTGKPLLLMLLPLSVGLALGYFLGRQQGQKESLQQPARNGVSFLSTIFLYLRDSMSFLCLCLFLRDQPHELSNQIQNERMDIGITTMILDHEKALEKDVPNLASREDKVRENLTSDAGTKQESGVEESKVPQHVAVIMDGNRRYGKEHYGNATRGHWDGSSKLVDFAKWCIAEKIAVLTVYAFSTENWNRPPDEVAALMSIFAKYCDELRVEAIKRNIRIRVLSTEAAKIPSHVQRGIARMIQETEHCNGLRMNICISYGSRGEIVEASKSLAKDVAKGTLNDRDIDEREFQKRLLTSHCCDPDVLIRTSGEIRISNFLLWQLAYTEMFFVDKPWPAIEKSDLLRVIRTFAKGRKRRFGK